MPNKAYRIKFRKREKGFRGDPPLTYIWIRYAPNVKAARESAEKAVKREYGDDAKVISVKLAKRY